MASDVADHRCLRTTPAPPRRVAGPRKPPPNAGLSANVHASSPPVSLGPEESITPRRWLMDFSFALSSRTATLADLEYERSVVAFSANLHSALLIKRTGASTIKITHAYCTTAPDLDGEDAFSTPRGSLNAAGRRFARNHRPQGTPLPT